MDILSPQSFWTVTPKPAFCVKLRHKIQNGTEEKIFLNFCTCSELPSPIEDIDEDRLALILESPEPDRYRIPISVGDPHLEEDKKGESCTAYDIILNEIFFAKRVQDSELFRTFLILVAIDAVESKYNVEDIDRQNWVILKNRKCVGDLQSQRIKKQARPLIVELEEDKTNISEGNKAKSGLMQKPINFKNPVAKSTKIDPLYEIRKDKAINPTKITITFYGLDGVRSVSDIELDVGLHRIRVAATNVKYEVNLYVPYSLNEHLVDAKFHVEQAKLIVEILLLIET